MRQDGDRTRREDELDARWRGLYSVVQTQTIACYGVLSRDAAQMPIRRQFMAEGSGDNRCWEEVLVTPSNLARNSQSASTKLWWRRAQSKFGQLGNLFCIFDLDEAQKSSVLELHRPVFFYETLKNQHLAHICACIYGTRGFLI